MPEELDEFIDELQDQIYEETKARYGKKAFERWLNMRYMGRMDNPDGSARLTGSCGDTMEIFLKFEDDRVKEASFITDGCGSSAVCGSFAVEMCLGKSPDEVLEISGERIIKVLGGLPEEEEHCAMLASETLHEALNDYMLRQTGKKAGS